jgi:hypothetical protein
MKYGLLFLLIGLVSPNIHAQFFPESFSYQAVLRDEGGNILPDNALNVRITLIWDAFGQLNEIYSETHQTTTNEFGLFNLAVGTGISGEGLVPNFADIPWENGYELKVDIDTGNGYVELGREVIKAAPYSMYSKGNWGLNGNIGTSPATNFIGTTDNASLVFRTNNVPQMALSSAGNLAMGHEFPAVDLDIKNSNGSFANIRLSHSYSPFHASISLVNQRLMLTHNGDESEFEISVGNGRFVMETDGKIGIMTPVPFSTLHVEDGTDVSLMEDLGGYLILGAINGPNITQDTNEIIARNDGQAATLFLNTEDGAVVINQNTTPPYDFYVFGTAAKPGGGSWATYSDANLKKDIKAFDVGLETLLKVNPVNFKYIPEFAPDPQTEYVGIIAQELAQIAPFMVQSAPTSFEDGHSEDFLSVDPSAFTYMLINAVKELHSQNEELKKQVEVQDKNFHYLLNEIQNLKSILESK